MRETFDQIAKRTGTDKSSEINDYCDFYEELWGHLRDDPIKMIEFGVFRGRSIAMWQEAFPKAEITGVDYNLDQIDVPLSARIIEGHAGNRDLLRELGEEHGPFDIVIDDSAHTIEVAEPILDTLFVDFVKPGGWLVIEDTAAHWKRYDGPNRFTLWAMEKVCEATHLSARMKTTKRSTWAHATPFQLAVDKAIVRPGIVVFQKVR